ncbi:O-antigen ligase family protein [Pontibacter sp. CAU 1760]
MLDTPHLDRRKLLLLALYGFVLSMPFAININSIFLILAALIWISRMQVWQDIKATLSHNAHRLLFLLYLLYGISVWWSSNKSAALSELELKSSFLLLPLLLTSLAPTKHERHRYLQAFVAAVTLAAVISLVLLLHKVFFLNLYRQPEAFLGMDWVYFSYHLPKQLPFHAPYFSMYSMLGVIILLFMVISNPNKQRSRLLRLIQVLTAVFLFAFTVVLASRTALASGVFVLVAGWLIYAIRRKRYALALVMVLLAAVGGWAAYTQIPYLKRKVENQYGISQRQQLWQASLSLGSQHLLAGVGSGDVKQELTDEKNRLFPENASPELTDPHNQYLHLLLSLGVPGLGVYLLYMGYALYLSWKNKVPLLAAFAVFFMLCSLTESNLQTQKGVILFSFLSALLLGSATSSTKEPSRHLTSTGC